MATTDERYINADEVAKFLSLTDFALRNLIFKKQIPFYRVGRRIKFLKSELIEWMEEGKVIPVVVTNKFAHSVALPKSNFGRTRI